MPAFKCYAPVFGKNSFFACVILDLIYTLTIIALLIGTLFLILLSEKGRCTIKQYQFRITHCMEGNSDPNREI